MFVCVCGIIVGTLTFGLILTLHAYATPLTTNHTLRLIMKVNNNDINRYQRNIYNTGAEGVPGGLFQLDGFSRCVINM